MEPSAGNGSFLNYLPLEKTVALDIEPQDKRILKKDFFDYIPTSEQEKILIIGNPPFGKNSSLAVKFFNHSASFANVIFMVLPKTFRKVSIQNRLDLNFHLEKEIIIDETFLDGDKEVKVPTVAQIWIKKDKKRDKVKLRTLSSHFIFTDKEKADLSVRRVGYYAGKCFKDKEKSVSSHYFLKSKIDSDKLFEYINEIQWKHENTAGTRSVSKHELIVELDKIVKKEEK